MSQFCDREAIGGYFALECTSGKGLPWLDDAFAYRSARAALAAALTAARPTVVWAPHYLCSAVDEALRACGAAICRYVLGTSGGVPECVELGPRDVLLVVDYFGLHADAVDRAIARHGVDRVVVDASQALFHDHRPGCTTIYSPRKFFGIPDGGLMRTSLTLGPRFDAIESDSIARSDHLLYRLAGMVEAGYAKFQINEASLSGCEPESMSQLTQAMLRSIDTEAVASLRVRNYSHLASSLRARGLDVPDLRAGAVPLCCPVRCDDAVEVRRKLASRRIFSPTYWPDANIPNDDRVALMMRDQVVYLPCDQRYETDQLDRVVAAMIDATVRRASRGDS